MVQRKHSKQRLLMVAVSVVGFLGLLLFGLMSVSMAAPAEQATLAPQVPTGKSTLGDYVWHDYNVDGEHTTTPGENEYLAGIPGVLVNLYLDTGDGQIQPGEYVTSTTTVAVPDSVK